MGSFEDMLAEDLQPGTMVGEYRVERLVGEGTFGKVYAATHPVIGKAAAIKVLGLEHAAKPQFVSRFVEEARAVNRIRHRDIVDIFSFGQLPDGRHYFVMELLEGETLTKALERRGRFPVPEALAIMRKVGRALDAAHAAGIAHRDLKPDNVFLTYDEDRVCHPKLLDFGIAKLMGDSPLGHRTATGTPMGTPLYMSPEQCRGQDIDQRTDIYAFGILLHEMLTGKRPFDADNVMEIMMAHMATPPPAMSSVASDLPAALDGPVLRMLDKDPGRRPATLDEALAALGQAAAQAGIPLPASVEMVSGMGAGSPAAFSPQQPGPQQLGPQPSRPQQPGAYGGDSGFGQQRPVAAAQTGWAGSPPQQQSGATWGAAGSAVGYPAPPGPTVPAQPAGYPGATQPSAGMPPAAHPMARSLEPAAATLGSRSPSERRLFLWLGGGCLFLFVIGLLLVGGSLVVMSDGDDDSLAGRGDAARFRFAVPPVGMVVENKGSMVMAVVAVQGGMRAELSHSSHTDSTVEVLAAGAKAVRSLEVRFHRAEEITAIAGGQEQREVKPITGNTYVAERGGNGLKIRYDRGEAPPEEEQRLVRQELEGIFHGRQLASLLAGKTLEVGESLEVEPKVARRLLGDAEQVELSDMRLKLRRVKGKGEGRMAVFDVQASLTMHQEGLQLKSELSGFVEIEVNTLWTRELTLHGPLELSAPAQEAEIESGSLSIELHSDRVER